MPGLSSLCVISDPNVDQGRPYFIGSRVPLHKLMEHLRDGRNLSEFLRENPGVRGDHARCAIEIAFGYVSLDAMDKLQILNDDGSVA